MREMKGSQVAAVQSAMNRSQPMLDKIEEAIDVHGPDLAEVGKAVGCSQDRALASMLAELCFRRIQPADREFFIRAFQLMEVYDNAPPEGHS